MRMALLNIIGEPWVGRYESERLEEEARARGLDLTVLYSQNETEQPDLSAYDKVLLRVNLIRDLDARLKWLLDTKNTEKCMNTPAALQHAKNKIKVYQALDAQGIAQIESFILQSTQELEALPLAYPLVLKDPCGSYGHGVMLAETLRSARSILDRLLPPWGNVPQVLAQAFVEEAQGKDHRLFVVKGRVVAAMSRQAQEGEFRSNAELGGSCEAYSPEKEELEVALKAAAALHLEIAGVDILKSKTGYKIIEVNPNPGFKALEKVTGVNIAGEILESCSQTFF